MSSVLDEVDALEPATDITSLMSAIKPAILLSLDVGTSGVRAALFDERGEEISGASVSRPRPFHSTADFAELDPDAILDQVIKVIDELLSIVSDNVSHIQFVAISCFWHSLMGIDDNGRNTSPLLTWADTRGAAEAKNLRLHIDEYKLHTRTGCRLHPSYWPAKLLWLKNHDHQTFEATQRWLGFSEYLAFKLFGDTSASISMASATGLFNQTGCDWDWELIDQLGIDREKLPSVDLHTKRPHLKGEFATRWPPLAEASLCAVAGDGASNNVGAGCSNEDYIALMVGTSGAMRVVYEGDPPARLPRGLWCYRVDKRRLIIGGAVSDGGGLYRWLYDSLFLAADPATVENELSAMEADAHGLTLLPFWSGERSVGWLPEARGAITGLTQQTKPIQILRAALEAIAFRFALILRDLESVAPNATIIASGNALRSSPSWLQIISDVLGQKIALSSAAEASTRGAALLALEAVGKINSIEDVSVFTEAAFEPNMERHEKYVVALKRQQELYQRLLSSN